MKKRSCICRILQPCNNFYQYNYGFFALIWAYTLPVEMILTLFALKLFLFIFVLCKIQTIVQ